MLTPVLVHQSTTPHGLGWTSGLGFYVTTTVCTQRYMLCSMWCVVQIRMHMYTPTFLVQKAAKIKNCSGDRLREEARSKKPEARIQEAPANMV